MSALPPLSFLPLWPPISPAMGSAFGPALWIFAPLLFLLLILYARNRDRRRQHQRTVEMRRLAVDSWLQFAPVEPFPLPAVALFQRGDPRGTINTLHGELAGRAVQAGDFFATLPATGSDAASRSHTEYSSYAWLPLPGVGLKPLLVRPLHQADKFSALLGMENLEVEGTAFSSAFFVHGSDRQFAVNFLTPAVVELLVIQRGWTLVCAPGGLLFLHGEYNQWPTEAFTGALQVLVELGSRLPPAFWDLYGHPQPPPAAAPNPYAGEGSGGPPQ